MRRYLLLIPLLLWANPALADCVLVNNPDCGKPTYSFFNYVHDLLKDNFPYVLLVALIMIIFSGVQYMTSGFTPDGQKLAKQRIFGILMGVIFYILLQFILNQISPNLKL